MSLSVVLGILFALEILLRAFIEVQEIRKGSRFHLFSILRSIPLVNDLTPPEVSRSEKSTTMDSFMKAHERAHVKCHHGLKRVLARIVTFLITLSGLVYALNDLQANIWQVLLILHFLVAVLRVPFHLVCWLQEYEADALAVKEIHSASAEKSLQNLALEEIPHSPCFALLYQEHPTARMRLKQVSGKNYQRNM